MIVRQTFSELIARMRSRRCPGGFVHFATRPVAPDTEVVLFDEDDFHDDDTIQGERRPDLPAAVARVDEDDRLGDVVTGGARDPDARRREEGSITYREPRVAEPLHQGLQGWRPLAHRAGRTRRNAPRLGLYLQGEIQDRRIQLGGQLAFTSPRRGQPRCVIHVRSSSSHI